MVNAAVCKTAMRRFESGLHLLCLCGVAGPFFIFATLSKSYKKNKENIANKTLILNLCLALEVLLFDNDFSHPRLSALL